MANCNDLFIDFHKEISLTPAQEDFLRTSRDAVADTIKEYFNAKGIKAPSFRPQGSLEMKTAINPADTVEGRHDIECGVFLEELPDCDGEKAKIQKVKDWIMEALADQTDPPPLNSRKYLRIYYEKYHIDLPIYKEENGKTYIGTRDYGWQERDPAALTDWFVGKVKEKGERMRRVVKYLKAAADNKRLDFKSTAITISVANLFVDAGNRDDKSFADTLENIIAHLQASHAINEPVFPHEDALQPMDRIRMGKLIMELSVLLQNAKEAVETEDRVEASKKWIQIFGARFKEQS